jgi:hypothetical protein
LLVQNEEDFRHLHEAAIERCAETAELLAIGMRRTGSQTEPYLDSVFDLSGGNKRRQTAPLIRRIVPILMIR